MTVNGIILKETVKKLGITQDDAARKLGISRQTFNNWCTRSELGEQIIKLVKLGLDIDLVNEKEKSFETNTSPRLEAKPVGLADPEGFDATGEKIYTLPDGSKIMEVKVIPVRSQAGYLRGFPDPEYYEDLPTLKVLVNSYHKGTYLAFEVQGDSMTPTDVSLIKEAVLEGWFVIGREVSKHLWNSKLHTHQNSKWVIVHKTEGILIKQIIAHDVEGGTITIHSLNPKYPDQVLNLDDCEQIFNVVKTEINDR